jgi:NADPH2:quinone reductase
MKAITFDKFGGAEELKYRDIANPVVKDDEVLINIKYTSVNPIDWKIRQGLFKDRMTHNFPVIPGWDAAGKIAEKGKNVNNFNVGDEVYAYTRKDAVSEGTYSEYIAVPSSFVSLKPKNIDFAQAAAIPLVGLTAWQSLFDIGKLQKGQTILIQAGAGGVGSFAIQLAKYIGATVITTTSTANVEYCKKLGADRVIDYKIENFSEVVKKAYPQGIDFVYEMVGGQVMADSALLIKKGGVIVSIYLPLDKAEAKRLGIRSEYCFVRPSGEQLAEITKLIDSGKIQIPQIEKMSFKDAARAQEKNRQGHTRGKIVLEINP